MKTVDGSKSFMQLSYGSTRMQQNQHKAWGGNN